MDRNENYQNNEYDYEEIDLKEIFNVLKKWRKTIVGVTIGAMLLSGIISWFIMKPVYEAKVVLTSPGYRQMAVYENEKYILREEENVEDDIRKIQDRAVELYIPQISVSQYPEIACSSYILNKVIDRLNLDWTYHQLSEKITAEKDKDSGFVVIKVQDNDPKQAALIANTIAEELSLYVKGKEAEGMKQSFNVLDKQLEAARQELDQAVKQLKDYKINNSSSGTRAEEITYELDEQKLLAEMERKKDAVDLLEAKKMELKIKEAFVKDQERVLVLSPAVVPEEPVKPKKMLNLAIAGVLGLMVSIFGVFLAEYLREDGENA
ncbi:Wzz/FepE/Etk N-terminal domain-containing protein [Thermosyntropha sp.]|uniref:YveK family protein n=1 Tax=Thermosyntropha sp. TaxID=2740820 RepID=UPI0025FFE571|nr:Wzz/FepE/Etk N-terminal domain-containing protein [Thermosyntropha sp.]MBO8159713.1 hypothetical protein [Thermosyntropha sp.]